MTAIEKHNFATLDAMRGVAAFAVVIFHFRFMLNAMIVKEHCFASGYLAVDLFFALSGFVIEYAYSQRLAAGMSFSTFLLLRLVRLLPMIWIGLIIGIIFVTWRGGFNTLELLAGILSNCFIMPSPVSSHGAMFSINGPEWSLFFELGANLLFAAFFPYTNGKRLTLLIVSSAVGLMLCAVAYRSLHDGYTYTTIHLGALRVSFSFFTGVALARNRGTWLPHTPKLPSSLVLGAAAAALYFPAPGSVRPVYDVLFVTVGSPILIMLAAAVEPSLAGRRLAAWLALGSYPIYAFHQPVRDIVTAATQGLAIAPEVAVASIVLLLPSSILLAVFYDEPVRKWALAHLRRKRILI